MAQRPTADDPQGPAGHVSGGPAPREPRLSTILVTTVLAVYTCIYVTSGVRDPGTADGYYSFLYARSLVFDGDLDFRNDYALCGDPHRQGIDRGSGRIDNPAYPGPALVWVPVLAAARLLAPPGPDASTSAGAGCDGPLARIALAVAMPLGALAMLLSYHAARHFAAPGAALMATLLFALASSLPQYAAVFVSSSHVFECVFAALGLWLSVRAVESVDSRRGTWCLVGLSLCALTMQRLPDACYAIVPLWLITDSALSRRAKVAAAAFVLAGVALGLVLMLSLYTYLYGTPWMLPQGRHFMHLARAHPFLLLFAPQGGLLYATPSAYLAVIGLAVACRDARYRGFALAAGSVMAVSLWIASSPLDWHAKSTFGARRLIVLIPLFVVFAARALHVAFAWVPRRAHGVTAAVAGAVVLALAAPVVGAVMGTITGATPLQAAPLHRPQAGRAYRAVAAIGDVAVLPASVLYAWRFKAPMRSFGVATTDLFYRRSYRDLSWEPNTLVFSTPALSETSRGAGLRDGGLALLEPTASVVFTAGWPFADVATLEASAAASGRLSVSLGTSWHRCGLGERLLEPGPNVLTFTIPAGCFDSGLIALEFRSATVGVTIERLTLNDSRQLLPPF